MFVPRPKILHGSNSGPLPPGFSLVQVKQGGGRERVIWVYIIGGGIFDEEL